jgi:hypothetical protein
MSKNKVFEGTMSNGVSYEIHESSGFTSHSELAVIINGKVVSLIEAEGKRGGGILCKGIGSGSILVKPNTVKTEEPATQENPDLIYPRDSEIGSDEEADIEEAIPSFDGIVG